MDTVTEDAPGDCHRARGGIGVIPQEHDGQAAGRRSQKVKRHGPGVCATRWSSPRTTVLQVLELSIENLGISGFPVCDGSKVIGIVTSRDVRF